MVLIKMSSKKTVLKVTPNVPVASQQKIKRKNDYLRECINVILKREMLHLNVKKVFDILVNDLNINLKNVTPRMKYILSECLCYYMKMWPGWQKYDIVCINERAKMDYIEKFKEYLQFKIRYIIQNEKVFNPDTETQNKSNMKSQEVQTDPINKRNKPEAPYNLVISGQPNVLNNIVFIEMDSNIVIKQHAEKAWKPLTVREFLNYSFVYVSIKLPDLELTRSNLHEFQRYITECGDTASCPNVDFITYVKKRSESSKPKIYTMDYIHAYCKQFLETIGKVPGINKIKIAELEEVFRQFVLDIQDSNVFSYTNSTGTTVSTMATDTTVCFNIGGKTYIRNKKMVVNNDNQKEANAINFCEVLIPRMAYTLAKFVAVEDKSTEDTSFNSLNEINLQLTKNPQEVYKFVEAVNSSVTYHCLLCPKVYTGDRAYIDILDHYRFLHKGEQSVLCFSCRKQFEIAKLAGSRWAHECGEGTDIDNTTATPTTSNTKQSVATQSRPAIGINDILASSKSLISVDDLLNNQTGASPSGGNVNNASISQNVKNTLPIASTAMTDTPTALPVVRVSTNTVLPPFSYNTILAITSGPVVSNTLISGSSVSTPLIATSTSLIIPPNTLATTTPLIATSNLLAVPQSPLVSDVPLNVDGSTNDIKIEVEEQENITDTSDANTSNPITVQNISLSVPILPAGDANTTSIILPPIIAAPIDSAVNVTPATVGVESASSTVMSNESSTPMSLTPVDAAPGDPTLSSSLILPSTFL